MREEIQRLSQQYQFFHWHLAFSDVFRVPGKDKVAENETTGRRGGFDVVLGNPPWEKVQPEEKQFFVRIAPDIAAASASKRKKLIDGLKTRDPDLYSRWLQYRRRIEAIGHYARGSCQYKHSAKGNLNLAYLFVDMSQQLLCQSGRLVLQLVWWLQTCYGTDELPHNGWLYNPGCS